MLLGSHQKRWVVVEDGRLEWFKPPGSTDEGGSSSSRKSIRKSFFGSKTEANTASPSRENSNRKSLALAGATEDDKKGVVDFRTDKCIAQEVGGSTSKFLVRPEAGSWSEDCNFTGAEGGRAFYFDAADSQHSREEWISAITRHVNFTRHLHEPVPETAEPVPADESEESEEEEEEEQQQKEEEEEAEEVPEPAEAGPREPPEARPEAEAPASPPARDADGAAPGAAAAATSENGGSRGRDSAGGAVDETGSDVDRPLLRELMAKYIHARRHYDVEEIESLFCKSGEYAAMNGYFGNKLMLEWDGKGLDFLLTFLEEEAEAGAKNETYRAEITSLEVLGHDATVATATLAEDGWETFAKGPWAFDEAFHLVKTEGVWRIVAKLYAARSDRVSGKEEPGRPRRCEGPLPEQLHASDEADVKAVTRVLKRYIRCRRYYRRDKVTSLFMGGGDGAVMNGYFGGKLMLDADGRGLPFLFSFLSEEAEHRTDNYSYAGEVASVRVFGPIATGRVIGKNWRTYDKGVWHFDEAFHLLKASGKWRIVSKLYTAVRAVGETPRCPSPPPSSEDEADESCRDTTQEAGTSVLL